MGTRPVVEKKRASLGIAIFMKRQFRPLARRMELHLLFQRLDFILGQGAQLLIIVDAFLHVSDHLAVLTRNR
jgi:hypothetical protein